MGTSDFLRDKARDYVWEWLTRHWKEMGGGLMIAIIEGWIAWFESIPFSYRIPLILFVFFVFVGILSLGIYAYNNLWGLSVKLRVLPPHQENVYLPDNGQVYPARYVRVEVINKKKKTIKCRAFLTQIEGLAQSPYPLFRDLIWKDEGDKPEIEIPYNSPRVFDIARSISGDNRLILVPPIMVALLENITAGDYIFTVHVKSGELSSKPYRVGIRWNGEWNEIETFNA